MLEDILTGQICFRTNWRGKLILQVYLIKPYDPDSDVPRATQTSLFFRDAQTSDLVALAMLGVFTSIELR